MNISQDSLSAACTVVRHVLDARQSVLSLRLPVTSEACLLACQPVDSTPCVYVCIYLMHVTQAVDVACGGDFTMVVSSAGDIYGTGHPEHGQVRQLTGHIDLFYWTSSVDVSSV